MSRTGALAVIPALQKDVEKKYQKAVGKYRATRKKPSVIAVLLEPSTQHN
jgi:hypothetical protein